MSCPACKEKQCFSILFMATSKYLKTVIGSPPFLQTNQTSSFNLSSDKLLSNTFILLTAHLYTLSVSLHLSKNAPPKTGHSIPAEAYSEPGRSCHLRRLEYVSVKVTQNAFAAFVTVSRCHFISLFTPDNSHHRYIPQNTELLTCFS